MYEGKISKLLSELIDVYHERFKDDQDDGFSLSYTNLEHDALVARLKRALSEGKPYNPIEEEWDIETREAFYHGDILI